MTTALEDAYQLLANFEAKKAQLTIEQQVEERKVLARSFWLFGKLANIVRYLGEDQYRYRDDKISISYDFNWNCVSAYWQQTQVFHQQNSWVDCFLPSKEFLSYVEELYEKSKESSSKKELEAKAAKERTLAKAFGLEG